MLPQLPSPITQENFSKAWSLTDSIRRKARKKYYIGKIACTFSNLVFSIMMLLACNGLIYDHATGSYCRFLREVPFLLSIWRRTGGSFVPREGLLFHALVLFAAICITCFLFCVMVALAVTALYHPLKRKIPTGSVKDNAERLHFLAKEARQHSARSSGGGALLGSILFVLGQFILIAMYWVTTTEQTEEIIEFFTRFIMDLLEPLLISESVYNTIQGNMLAPGMMLFCVGIFLAYTLLNQFHTLSVRFLYRCPVPYSFVAQAEYYAVFAGDDTSGLTREEAEAQRREQAAGKREEALALERIHAHGKAKALLAEAAHGGDIPAMEHYARHWLIAQAKDPARYWLQRCVDSGQASKDAVKTLRRLKWRRRVQASYLQ